MGRLEPWFIAFATCVQDTGKNYGTHHLAGIRLIPRPRLRLDPQ